MKNDSRFLLAFVFVFLAHISTVVFAVDLECVPYARGRSNITAVRGDAYTAYANAQNGKYGAVYSTGNTPQVGSVLVWKKSGSLPVGHVAYVAQLIDSRTIKVDHANWPLHTGEHVGVTVTDTSQNNDWSSVSFWMQLSRSPLAVRYCSACSGVRFPDIWSQSVSIALGEVKISINRAHTQSKEFFVMSQTYTVYG